MTTFAPRAITAPEQVYLRSDGFFSRLHMAIISPATVFACRLNGLPPANDNVTWLTYNTVTVGAYTSVLADMTLYVGSYAGGYDLGQVRVKSATSTVLYIARTSEIAWVNGCYLTVVNEFNLWPRQAFFSGGAFLVDDDLPYTNQHSVQTPVPVLGPDAVLRLVTSTVTFTPDASLSWTLSGTIASYLWTAPGASATANMNTATPNIVYNAAGTYRVGCTVTGSNGASYTGYRTVYVWNTANPGGTHFALHDISGDWADGGWSFSITMWDQASFTYIRDRAKVILFTEDYYGGAAMNLSYATGYESILSQGWIQGESIKWNAEQSSVDFTVKGANYWLGMLPSWPAGIIDVGEAPANITNADKTVTSGWMFYQNLTYDAFAWHILNFRSTATRCIDVLPSLDTRRIIGSTAPWGNIWGQIKQMGESKLLITPCVDHLGRLVLQLDIQYVPVASRSTIPIVMSITKNDMSDTVEITRRIVPEKSQIDLRTAQATGNFVNKVENINLFRSGSSGSALNRNGQPEIRSEIVASSQAQSNEIAGLLMGEANNPYPQIVIPLGENNRFFDVCPYQYSLLNVAATDTPRGIVMVDQYIVVRRIEGNHDEKSGQLSWTLTAEAMNIPYLSVTLPMDLSKTIIIPPYIPGPIHPKPPVFPPRIPPNAICLTGVYPTGPTDIALSTAIISGGPTFTKYFHCWLRPNSVTYKSQLNLSSTLLDNSVPDTDFGPFEVWAIDNHGTEILQGTPVAYTGGASGVRSLQFLPTVATEIWGFDIKLPAAGGSTSFSGTLYPCHSAPCRHTCTPMPAGNYHISFSGGPWWLTSALDGYTYDVTSAMIFAYYGATHEYDIYVGSELRRGLPAIPRVWDDFFSPAPVSPGTCTIGHDGIYGYADLYLPVTGSIIISANDAIASVSGGSMDYLVNQPSGDSYLLTIDSATVENVCS